MCSMLVSTSDCDWFVIVITAQLYVFDVVINEDVRLESNKNE